MNERPARFNLLANQRRPVDANLYREGKPSLQADMQQTELRVKKIEVKMFALSFLFPQHQLFGVTVTAHSNGLTRFYGGKHANQPFASGPLELGGYLCCLYLAFGAISIKRFLCVTTPNTGAWSFLLECTLYVRFSWRKLLISIHCS